MGIDNTISKQAEELKRIGEEKEAVSSQLNILRNDFNALQLREQDALAKAKVANQEAKKIAEESNLRLIQVTTELNSLKALNDSLTQDTRAKNEELVTVKQENSTLKDQLSTNQVSLIEITSKLEDVTKKNEGNINEIAQLKAQVESLKTENYSLAGQLAEAKLDKPLEVKTAPVHELNSKKSVGVDLSQHKSLFNEKLLVLNRYVEGDQLLEKHCLKLLNNEYRSEADYQKAIKQMDELIGITKVVHTISDSLRKSARKWTTGYEFKGNSLDQAMREMPVEDRLNLINYDIPDSKNTKKSGNEYPNINKFLEAFELKCGNFYKSKETKSFETYKDKIKELRETQKTTPTAEAPDLQNGQANQM